MRTVPTSIAAKLPRAAELIAERGLDQTKIEELAEVTGIPKATLYYYFTGKEEILVFLLRDLLTQVADAVAIGAESEGSAAERLAVVVRAQLEVMADQPAVWRALIADLGRAARMPELAAALVSAYYAPLERLLTEGAADGSLRAVEDPAATSMAIFGAATVAGLHHLLAGEPLDAERMASQVIAFVLRGVSA
ncbi:MAG TPA: TetR/AcrR family transcriptional regulator [Acidimicrobiales bacterium]|nr:TetR/AcrR family transcriptional regulator [Acidimicrobiales bacterium]